MIYTIEELRERITPVAKKYQIRAVYVFGSYARNEATANSDIDILIDREGAAVRGIQMGALYNDLCECVGKEVDLVTLQTLEQESTQQRTPWFAENIRSEMVKIV